MPFYHISSFTTRALSVVTTYADPTSSTPVELPYGIASVFAIAALVLFLSCTSAGLWPKVTVLGALVGVLSSRLWFATASDVISFILVLASTPVPSPLFICALVLAALWYNLTVITAQTHKIRCMEAHLQALLAEERRLRAYAVNRDQTVWRLAEKLDNVKTESSKQSERIAALETGLDAAEAQIIKKDLALEETRTINLAHVMTIRSHEADAKDTKIALAAARSSVAERGAALEGNKEELREAKDLIQAACARIEDLEAQSHLANVQLTRVTASSDKKRGTIKKLRDALAAKDFVISTIAIARDEASHTSEVQRKTNEDLVNKVKVLEEDRASHQKESLHFKETVESLSKQNDFLSNEAISRSWELSVQENRWLVLETAMRKTINDLYSIIEEANLVSPRDLVPRAVDYDEQRSGNTKPRRTRIAKSRKQAQKVDAENTVPCSTPSSWVSSTSAHTLAASPASIANSSATLGDPASPTTSELLAKTGSHTTANSSSTLAHQPKNLSQAQPEAVLTRSTSHNVETLDVSYELGSHPIVRLSTSSEMLFGIDLDYPSWTALSPSPSST